MSGRVGARLRRALVAPHVVLAAVVLVASAVFVLRGSGMRTPTVQHVEIGEPTTAAAVPTEVRLLLVDAQGLQRPRFETLPLPPDPAGRLAAVLAALRATLMSDGVWPADLPTPTVFVQDIDGRSVAVLDLRPARDVAVSVRQELQLLRSIQGTVTGNGVDAVRFLRDGHPATTLLGHVAVPDSL